MDLPGEFRSRYGAVSPAYRGAEFAAICTILPSFAAFTRSNWTLDSSRDFRRSDCPVFRVRCRSICPGSVAVRAFRWSETAAGVIVSVPAGLQEIRIYCVSVRDLSDAKSDLRFYINGECIPSSQLSIEEYRVSIILNMSGPEIIKLGWTCLPFVAVADSRQLGLPIKGIELSAVIGAPNPATLAQAYAVTRSGNDARSA